MHRVKPTRSSINGPWADGLAAQQLEGAGLKVTSRNCRVRSGEIDLIALEYLGRNNVACRFDAVLVEGDARAFNVT